MKWKIIFLIKIMFTSIRCIHSDLLVDLNKQFLSTYDRARNHMISTIDPLITCNGDNATIIHRGKQYQEQIIPELYHQLKSISHIPFKIYLTIMFDGENLSDDHYIELKQYLEDLYILRKSIQFPENIQKNQYDIIDLSIEYLEEILKTKSIDQIQLNHFCRQARILFTSNINIAARIHLDMLDSKIRPWYETHFTDSERKSLKILIMGPKTARYGYLIKAYFYALLNEHYEGKHILYVENADNEQKALEILGIWLLDEKAGQSFFDGDSERLHRDLLADAANLYIEKFVNKSKYEL